MACHCRDNQCPPGNSPCADLVARYLKGDEAARRELPENFRPLAQGVVRRLGIHDREESDDLSQDVWIHITATRTLAKWRRDSFLCAYLWIAASHKATSVRRQYARRLGLWRRFLDVTRPVLGVFRGGGHVEVDAEVSDCIEAALAKLEPKHRDAAERFLRGESYKQIADANGLTPRAIRYWFDGPIKLALAPCLGRILARDTQQWPGNDESSQRPSALKEINL
jgi:DNA-directed RNA polymerase specialized sigma24 family protein